MAGLKLPPGFRFHPTDAELVEYYLTEKAKGTLGEDSAITEIDLLAYEPWDLRSLSRVGEDRESYFFCPRDRKYPNGSRANRATEKGYWKATGKDKHIFATKGKRQQIGMKKTLVFYQGRAPRGARTDYVMHEYRLEAEGTHSHLRQGDHVLCRIFKKNAAKDDDASPAAAVGMEESEAPSAADAYVPGTPADASTLVDDVPSPVLGAQQAAEWGMGLAEPKMEALDDTWDIDNALASESAVPDLPTSMEAAAAFGVADFDQADFFTGLEKAPLSNEEQQIQDFVYSTKVEDVQPEEEQGQLFNTSDTSMPSPAAGTTAGGDVPPALWLDGDGQQDGGGDEIFDGEQQQQQQHGFQEQDQQEPEESSEQEAEQVFGWLREPDEVSGGEEAEAFTAGGWAEEEEEDGGAATAGDGAREQPRRVEYAMMARVRTPAAVEAGELSEGEEVSVNQLGAAGPSSATGAVARGGALGPSALGVSRSSSSRRSLEETLRSALRSHGVPVDEADLGGGSAATARGSSPSSSSGSGAVAGGIRLRRRPLSMQAMSHLPSSSGAASAFFAAPHRMRLQVMTAAAPSFAMDASAAQDLLPEFQEALALDRAMALDLLPAEASEQAALASLDAETFQETYSVLEADPAALDYYEEEGDRSGASADEPGELQRAGDAGEAAAHIEEEGRGAVRRVVVGGRPPQVTVQALGSQPGATSDGGHDRGGPQEGTQWLPQPHGSERVLGVARSSGGALPALYAASMPVSAQQHASLDPTTAVPAAEGPGDGQASTSVPAGTTHRAVTAGAVPGAVPPVGPAAPLTDVRGGVPEVARRGAASSPASANPGAMGMHPPRAPTQSAPTTTGQAPRRMMPTSTRTTVSSSSLHPQSADTTRTLVTSRSHPQEQRGGAQQQSSARTRPLIQAIHQSRRDRALQLEAAMSEPLAPSRPATSVRGAPATSQRQPQAQAPQFPSSAAPAAAPAVGKPASQSNGGGRGQGGQGQAAVPSALVWVLERLPVLPASAAELPGCAHGTPRRHSENDLKSTGRAPARHSDSWGYLEDVNSDAGGVKREERKLERSGSLERRPLFSSPTKGGVYSIFKGFFAPIERWGPVDWMIVGAVAACAVHAAGHSLGFFS